MQPFTPVLFLVTEVSLTPSVMCILFRGNYSLLGEDILIMNESLPNGDLLHSPIDRQAQSFLIFMVAPTIRGLREFLHSHRGRSVTRHSKSAARSNNGFTALDQNHNDRQAWHDTRGYTPSGGQRDGLKDVLLQELMHHQGPLVTGRYVACVFCYRGVRPAAGEGDETC